MKRRSDFDILRVLCMCAVVYLHTAEVSFQNLANRSLWEMSCWINVLAVLAVPLFFMMSGALVLGSGAKSHWGYVLRRRVGKVLLPLAAWSAVTLLFLALVKHDPEGALQTARHILNTPANVAYWFLYALIPMYLLIPLLKPAADRLEGSAWRYLLALWLVLTLGLPTLRSFLPEPWQLTFQEHWSLNINAVGGYLGYFLLGAYLDRRERLPSKKLLAWGTVAASVAAGLLSHGDAFDLGRWSDRFTGYLTVFTALRSAGMFLLFKALWGERETKSRCLQALSGCSFAVYLAHPIVIMVAKELWFSATGTYDPAGPLSQLALYAGILAVCVLAALTLGSVPVLCRVFTGQSFSAACRGGSLPGLFRREGRLDNQGRDD